MATLEPIAVTMAEAARLLGVSRPTVYALAKTEGFPVVKLGACTRVLVDDLKAWVREQDRLPQRLQPLARKWQSAGWLTVDVLQIAERLQ